MSFLDSIGDAVDAVVDKGKGSVKAAGSILSAPVGAVFDVARWMGADDTLNKGVLKHISMKNSLAAAADTLIGEGTLTGWTISKAGQALDKTYRYGIENPIETVIMAELMPPSADPMSWSEAWEMSKKRNLGQTAELWGNASAHELGDALGGINGDALVRGIPILGSYLAEAGVGAEENKDIDVSDEDAWKEFQKTSPFWSGFTASTIDLAAQFAVDPFTIASKGTKGVREMRKLRPIMEGEEVGLAERMAEETTRGLLGGGKKAGLASRTEPLIGSVRYEPRLAEDGKHAVDETGAVLLDPVMDRAGWLDGKSSAEVYAGLGLKNLPSGVGTQMASLLAKTNKIDNAADRVNIRRDILAAAGGDAKALGRLRDANAGEYADILSNAFQAKGSGSVLASVRDHANGLDSWRNSQFDPTPDAGVAVIERPMSTHGDPSVLGEAVREVSTQADYESWLYSSMKDRTLRVSAAGERAVARLNRQGLGRDGTLHTGLTKVDQFVNDRVIGKFKSDGSFLDDGLAKSDQFEAGRADDAGLAGGRVIDSDVKVRATSATQMPVTVSRGIKLARWASGGWAVKGAAKASDSLRGRTIQGWLPVEDDHADLAVAVMQDRFRRTGMDPEAANGLLSDVVAAANPTERAVAVSKAESAVQDALAKKYGIDGSALRALSVKRGQLEAETSSAIRGQRYSASVRADGTATDTLPDGGESLSFMDDGGLIVTKLGDGTEAVPVLSTQTPNYVPLVDVDYVERWLKRDNGALGAIGRHVDRLWAKSPGTAAARTSELGLSSRTLDAAKEASDRLLSYWADMANANWKRAVLLTRAVPYAVRNTLEEEMRVWSIGKSAMVTDAAVKQGAMNARAWTRALTGREDKWREAAPEFAAKALHQQELDELTALQTDPEMLKNLDAARALMDEAVATGDQESIDFVNSLGYLQEHESRAADIAALQDRIKGLDETLAKRSKDMSGTRTIEGFEGIEFPDAFAGESGKRFRDLLNGGGQFDKDVTGYGERTYGRFRGTAESDIIRVSHPGDAANPGVVSRHATAWSWVLNKQIRQAPDAQAALRSVASGDDAELTYQKVLEWVQSPQAARWREMNPRRSADPEAWAQDITDLVRHYVPTQNLAHELVRREVPKAELVSAFDNVLDRPDVHVAGVDALLGSKGRMLEVMSSKAFKKIDEMSVQRFTRHPLYQVFFHESQERLAKDYQRLAVAERGEDAALTLDEVNRLSDKARREALNRVKSTFYDVTSRSMAAEKLRFMYPFFAAHQDSLSFWGKAIAADPSVLRKMQIAFAAPAQVGLVVDQDGNPVEPGTFPSSDHYILMQMPKAWGGPDPQSAEGSKSGFRLPLSSFNLALQNGSVLNPGAGPLAAVPAGWIQRQWADDEQITKAMKWFNPFGAPMGESFSDNVWATAAPTPFKRLRETWDAFMENDASKHNELYSFRLQEAQVRFYEKNGRPPSDTEAKKMMARVADEVKHGALLRFFASELSPVQPRPQTKLQGFVDEYRRLQEKGRAEGRGYFWATETFLDMYGEQYMALTKSSSEYRANVDPTAATVGSLKQHNRLVETTDPSVWQIIVGNEGEGAFSIDAYRWMQNKKVSAGSANTLIDEKNPEDRVFETSVATGWRAYQKMQNQLLAVASANGLNSWTESPQLQEVRSLALKELGEQYPQWYSEYLSPVKDYDSRIIPSLESVAKNKRLLNDPARSDIRVLSQYLEGRRAVQQVLNLRNQAGGSADISAKQNADVAVAYSVFVSQLAESNTVFSDYHMPGLIEKDPLYSPEILAEVSKN